MRVPFSERFGRHERQLRRLGCGMTKKLIAFAVDLRNVVGRAVFLEAIAAGASGCGYPSMTREWRDIDERQR
jgi:hypothetical protein